MNKMRNKRFIKRRHGFTLVEVIVAMALLSLILLMASSLLTTGRNMYKKGTVKADIQFDARMAADFITNELRNATEIGFGDRPVAMESSHSWIGIENKSIRYKTAGDSNELKKTGDNISSLEITGISTGTVGGKTRQIIEFTIQAEDNSEIKTKVLLNNYLGNLSGISVPSPMSIYYKKPTGSNDVYSVADRIGPVTFDYINNTFIGPSVPAGYSIQLVNTSNSTIIQLDRKVNFPTTGDTSVTLTFRISKGSESTEKQVTVIVPMLTPQVIADNIDRIPAIVAGDAFITLPDVPDGFDIEIKSSSNEAVISTSGAIIMQDESVFVDIVFTITKTGFSPAETGVIRVLVPAKMDALAAVDYNVAMQMITGTTALMQYSLGGTETSPSGTWIQAGEGSTTGVDFRAGSVWIRQSDNPSNMRILGIIPEPEAAPTVSLKKITGNTYKFVKSNNGTGDQLEGDVYEYSLNSGSWTNIGANETIEKNGNPSVSVRRKAKKETLPSQQATGIGFFN